jgi:hypothetical protein
MVYSLNGVSGSVSNAPSAVERDLKISKENLVSRAAFAFSFGALGEASRGAARSLA